MTTTTQFLPHDDYIAAVADALTEYGAMPGIYWTEEDEEGRLLAVIRDWPAGTVDTDTWLHGVSLIWDQYAGWRLLEDGGGRNVTALDPEGVNPFSSPRQVACSTANALRGHLVTGPICQQPWDSRPLEASIARWLDDDPDGQPAA